MGGRHVDTSPGALANMPRSHRPGPGGGGGGAAVSKTDGVLGACSRPFFASSSVLLVGVHLGKGKN